MHARSVKLPLIREEQTFYACAAIIRGEWAPGALLADQLHPEEKAAYDAFPSRRRKESFLLGRLSARQAILGLAGIDNPHAVWIDTGVFQFPVVRGAAAADGGASGAFVAVAGGGVSLRPVIPLFLNNPRVWFQLFV